MHYTPGIADHLLAWSFGCVLPILTVINYRRFRSDKAMTLSTQEKIRFYRMNSLFLCGMGGSTLLVWTLNGHTAADLGLMIQTAHFTANFWGLLALFLILYMFDVAMSFTNNKARKRTAIAQERNIPFIPSGKKQFLWYLLMCIAAGIGEEIFFRGFLIQYIQCMVPTEKYRMVLAITIPAVCFTMGHAYQGAKALFKILLLSLLFGLLYVSSQSLLPVILLHAGIDALNGWLSMTLLKNERNGKIRKLE